MEKIHIPFLPLPSFACLLPWDTRTTIFGLLRLNIRHFVGSLSPSVLDWSISFSGLQNFRSELSPSQVLQVIDSLCKTSHPPKSNKLIPQINSLLHIHVYTCALMTFLICSTEENLYRIIHYSNWRTTPTKNNY